VLYTSTSTESQRESVQYPEMSARNCDFAKSVCSLNAKNRARCRSRKNKRAKWIRRSLGSGDQRRRRHPMDLICRKASACVCGSLGPCRCPCSIHRSATKPVRGFGSVFQSLDVGNPKELDNIGPPRHPGTSRLWPSATITSESNRVSRAHSQSTSGRQRQEPAHSWGQQSRFTNEA